MAWHSLGKNERVGDVPVELAKAAFEKLIATRPLAAADVATLLTATIARSSRELQPRREAKLVGLTVVTDEGTTETNAEEAKPAAEELAVLRDWVKKAAAEYKALGEELGRRRPTANELCETARRALTELVPAVRGVSARYEHAKGRMEADEIAAILAAAFRRNERRLGLLVERGEKTSPDAVVVTTEDGKTITVSCEEGQASRELVDEMCDRFDAILREHRQEQPEKFLASLSPQDRERYERNADARGLPTLEALVAEVQRQLAEVPERWAPLKELRVETSERSGIGLPSRPRPVAFVDSRIRVRHGKFGEGYVERTFEDGEKKYEVVFDGGKRVTLLARFLETV